MTISGQSRRARTLKAIQAFISRDSDLYALRIIEALIAWVEEISNVPTWGHPVHEHPRPGLREIHAASHRIIYQYDETTLSVVTIVHMKQKLPRRRLR